MEALLVLMVIIALLAIVGSLAMSFGAESRETFVDPRQFPVT